jgi:hypothetical protein
VCRLSGQLGGNTGEVAGQLIFAARHTPAEFGCHQVARFRRCGNATVANFDGSPGTPGENVL